MQLLKFIHRCYKVILSPLLGERCRFFPSCSDYALEACEKHGALFGAWLSMKRFFRCHPFAEGGLDPVPPTCCKVACCKEGNTPATNKA